MSFRYSKMAEDMKITAARPVGSEAGTMNEPETAGTSSLAEETERAGEHNMASISKISDGNTDTNKFEMKDKLESRKIVDESKMAETGFENPGFLLEDGSTPDEQKQDLLRPDEQKQDLLSDPQSYSSLQNADETRETPARPESFTTPSTPTPPDETPSSRVTDQHQVSNPERKSKRSRNPDRKSKRRHRARFAPEVPVETGPRDFPSSSWSHRGVKVAPIQPVRKDTGIFPGFRLGDHTARFGEHSAENGSQETVLEELKVTEDVPQRSDCESRSQGEEQPQRAAPSSGSNTDEFEDIGWDNSLEVPRQVDDTCSRACAMHFETFLKVALVSTLFLLVLGGGAIHLMTLIIMANEMWQPNDSWYACSNEKQTTTCLPLTWTNQSETPSCLSGNLYYMERCSVAAAPWAWGLLLVLVTPDLLVTLRCLFYWLTDSVQGTSSADLSPSQTRNRRRIKAYLAVILVESLRAFGVCLFVFVVLPLVESDLHRVVLMSCTALVPGVTNLLLPNKQTTNRYWRACDVISALCQVAALVMWPLLVGLQVLDWSLHLTWAIPLSLILVSAPYLFNYYDSPRTSSAADGLVSGIKQLRFDIYNERNSIYLVASFVKVVLSFSLMCLFTSVTYKLDVFSLSYSSCGVQELTPADLPGLDTDWAWVLLINVLSGLICYLAARTASRICSQVIAYAVPLMLTPLLVFFFVLGSCETYLTDVCYFERLMPAHLSLACPLSYSWYHQLFTQWAWLFFVWWLSKLWIARHIWYPTNIKLAKADSIFFAPLYEGVFLENSLMMNRMKQVPDDKQVKRPVPMVKICATMWHEDRAEMASLIKSICRLDIDQGTRAFCQKQYDISDPDFYNFEGHIFFDDAVEKFNESMKLEKGSSEADFDVNGKRVNGFVRSLVSTVQEASINYPMETPIRNPEKITTPYGGRLVWTLPGGNKIIVHLKDKSQIKHKKRWSQVMYMYYFMGYELNQKKMNEGLTKEQLQDYADSTFLLALDGDVDFEPKAIVLLLDRMRRDNIVGAVCGRIHPIGAGPMVWYQKFEYALGHWLQKSTEHVLGSVLCSPGCFSLFRGSAIMDVNVMKAYTHESTEAHHHVQYDQGEDRWLCTLLLQQGWHVEYCAASDAFTQAPTGFDEFFKQRRRWMPSTMANILDLLLSWRSTIQRNPYVTFGYIAYQMLMFVLSLLGSGTIFLMITDAVSDAFSNLISPYWFMLTNLALIISFVTTCFLTNENIQINLAMVWSTIYAVAQGVVLVSVIVNMAEAGPCSDTFIFFMLVAGVFLLAAIVHPKEFFCVVHGLLYFFLVPSMYMLLMIYALMNLNNVSWGVRETAESGITKAIEKSKEKKAQLELEEQVAQASGLRKFFGLGAAGNGRETGWTMRLGGCLRCTCCPRDADNDMEGAMAQTARLETKVETITEMVQEIKNTLQTQAAQSVTEVLPDNTLSTPVTSGLHLMTSPMESVTDHIEEANCSVTFPCDAGDGGESVVCRESPSTWLADRQYMPAGDVDDLPETEEQFFKELIEKYLKPKIETEAGKQQLKKDLKDLRNKVAFSYLLLNTMFIIIVFTLKQLSVRIPWFCGATIDPISLIFIALFGFILILQTLGMLAHRFDTVVQIVANTSVTGAEERRARQGVHDLFDVVRTHHNFRSDSAPPSVTTDAENQFQTRRKLTVIQNSNYQAQLRQAQQRVEEAGDSGTGSENPLEAVLARRVSNAVRADPKKHRKSILMREPPRGLDMNLGCIAEEEEEE